MTGKVLSVSLKSFRYYNDKPQSISQSNSLILVLKFHLSFKMSISQVNYFPLNRLTQVGANYTVILQLQKSENALWNFKVLHQQNALPSKAHLAQCLYHLLILTKTQYSLEESDSPTSLSGKKEKQQPLQLHCTRTHVCFQNTPWHTQPRFNPNS